LCIISSTVQQHFTAPSDHTQHMLQSFFAHTALILEPEKDTVVGSKNVTFIVVD